MWRSKNSASAFSTTDVRAGGTGCSSLLEPLLERRDRNADRATDGDAGQRVVLAFGECVDTVDPQAGTFGRFADGQ